MVKECKKIYKCKYNNGNNYDRKFKNDKNHDEGIYIWNGDKKFIGEWKENKIESKGIYKFKNGDILNRI